LSDSVDLQNLGARSVLEEFVTDVHAAYPLTEKSSDGGIIDLKSRDGRRLSEDWYDLLPTYRKAEALLKRWERMQMPQPGKTVDDPMKIMLWAEEPHEIDTDTVGVVWHMLEIAGNCLDHACSHDIVGPCVFQADDGVWYVGGVEFCIDPLNPELIPEMTATAKGVFVCKDCHAECPGEADCLKHVEKYGPGHREFHGPDNELYDPLDDPELEP